MGNPHNLKGNPNARVLQRDFSYALLGTLFGHPKLGGLVKSSLSVSQFVSQSVRNAFFSETAYSIFAKFYRITEHVKTLKSVEGIFKIWLGS